MLHIIWILPVIFVGQLCLCLCLSGNNNDTASAEGLRIVSSKAQIKVNDTYNVTCVAPNVSAMKARCGNVSNVIFQIPTSEFALNNSYILNETAVTVYGDSSTSDGKRQYICSCNGLGITPLYIQVTVQEFRVKNFSCQLLDFREVPMKCTFQLWEYNQKDVTTSYKIYYDKIAYNCTRESEFIHCNIDGNIDMFQAKHTYRVEIKDPNTCMNEEISLYLEQVLITERPFYRKSVKTNITANSIGLEWEHGVYSNYNQILMKWDLQLEPNNSNIKYTLPEFGLTEKLYVENLPHSYRKYKLKLRRCLQKGNITGHWSDFSIYEFNTTAVRPEKSPKLWPTGFYLDPGNRKALIVYWQQLNELDYNGPNFTYNVIVYNTKKIRQVNLTVPSDSNSAYIKDLDITKNGYSIEVRSQNANGTSVNSSRIDIVQLDQPKQKIPRNVRFTDNKKGITWDPPIDEKYLNYYTVFWCRSSDEDHNVCIKSESIHSLELAGPQLHYSTNLLPNDSYRWAVSANYADESGSGGMQWLDVRKNYNTENSKYDVWQTVESIVALIVLGTTIHLVFKKYRKMANITIVLPEGMVPSIDKNQSEVEENHKYSRSSKTQLVIPSVAYASVIPALTTEPKKYFEEYIESEPAEVYSPIFSMSDYVMPNHQDNPRPNGTGYVEMHKIQPDNVPTTNGYIMMKTVQPKSSQNFSGYTKAPEPRNHVC